MFQPIKIDNLKKSYGDIVAVNEVSLEVGPGEIYGLIGPDGAGKTTLIRILVSLLAADAGEVMFQGKPVRENSAYVRSHIGYMPQRFSLYRDLSVQQNLRFFGDLFQIPRNLQQSQMEKLYEFSKLGPFQNRLAGALSGGMKQKLALSCMLMHQPRVIVLDEPTFGVDPVSRSEFWDILKELAGEGISILVSTAYMDEANLCHRVGLIHQGCIMAQDRPDELIRAFDSPLLRICNEHPHEIYEALKRTELADAIQLFGDGVHVIDRTRRGRGPLIRLLKEQGVDYSGVDEITPNLENIFLELMR